MTLSNLLDSTGYPNLKNIIQSSSKYNFIQLIGILGLLFGGITLLIKELNLNRNHESSFIYIFSKISTDLTLAPFNLMAFFFGWGMYLYTYGALSEKHCNSLILILTMIVFMMTVLAIISLVIRAKPDEYLFQKFYAFPRIARILLSFAIVCCSVYVITIG